MYGNIPKKFSVSAFLMLVLIRTALCIPVQNNNNKLSDKKIDEFFELTEKLRNFVQHKLQHKGNAKLENLVGQITSTETNKKFKDLLAELSKENVSETYKKLVDELTNIAEHELAGAKFNEFLNHINSSETDKKVKELLSELSDVKLAETYKKLIEQLKSVADRELAVVRAKYEDFIAHINKPEANQKLQALLAELTPENSAEIYKKLTERMTNVAKHELAGIKAKIDDLVKHITSAETQKKLKDLMAELSEENLEGIYIKVAMGITKLVQQEVATVKAKIDEFVGHTKPGNKKNL